MKYARKRGIVVSVVFASVVVGLVAHTATGTESALGWRDIAAICPVGALEVLAGNHGLALHAVLLLAGTVVLALVFGKSFCAWLCPTPYVRALFGVRRKRAGASGEGREAQSGCSPEAPAGAQGAACPKRADALDAGEKAHAAEPTCVSGVLAGIRAASSNVPPLKADMADVPCEGARPLQAAATALAPRGGSRDGRYFDSRHAVLLGAIGSSFVFGFPVFCLVCPIGITFAIVIGLFNLVVHADTSWGLLVFPALLVLELVVCRRWCTHLCPVGALLSLLSSRLPRLLRPQVDAAKCLRNQGVDCRVCVGECPEEVDPHSGAIPECSNCGSCADACPAQAIVLTWEKRLPSEVSVKENEG